MLQSSCYQNISELVTARKQICLIAQREGRTDGNDETNPGFENARNGSDEKNLMDYFKK
jgi:hypothetical protein